jgi:hypothetical protein
VNKIRISIETEEGTRYSWIETDEHWDHDDFVTRYAVSADFAKEDLDDPTMAIYGVLEALGQSEECPPFMWTETLVKGSIEWLGES